MRHWARQFPLLACVVAATTWGCTASREELSVGHRDPSIKIPGMKKAAREHDRAAVRQLVADLDSDDPAVRFYAIGTLQRLTGTDLGYHYYDDEVRRKPALARWQAWLEGNESDVAATRPAGSVSGAGNE